MLFLTKLHYYIALLYIDYHIIILLYTLLTDIYIYIYRERERERKRERERVKKVEPKKIINILTTRFK